MQLQEMLLVAYKKKMSQYSKYVCIKLRTYLYIYNNSTDTLAFN